MCSVTVPRSTTAISREPGSCIGGSPSPPVAAPGAELVARQLGALAGQRRREDLERVAGGPAAAPALGGADDADVVGLVEPEQLREAQVQPVGDAGGDGERRARLAALDLREHRRRDAGALGEVAQAEVHRLAQRPDPRADVDLLVELLLVGDGHGEVRTLSRTNV